MKYKIVLVPFPFDDLSANKVRPAVCLTDEIQPYGHVILAFITSKVSSNPDPTDLIINSQDTDFAQTGLKVSLTIRLHRLMKSQKLSSSGNSANYQMINKRKLKTVCENYLESKNLKASQRIYQNTLSIALQLLAFDIK